MKSYDEMVRDLRERAERFDYDGWVDTAIVLESAADAIEELSIKLNEVDLPPVKIGDEVYFAYEWLEQICRGTVSMLQQKADKSWKFRVSHGSSVSDYPISAIGKTVFLTYAEAERCLADMREREV